MKRCLILTAALLLISASSAFAHGDKAERWFDRLDTNKDGIITQAEMEARGAERFAEIDANGDGMISAEEFSARAKTHFTRADKDGNGEITKQEFIAAKEQWRKQHEKAQ
jgi:Ca2+-binding EF-hand superfamily protein